MQKALSEHHVHIGPVTGAWLCGCGTKSTNGHIRTGDVTTKAERCAEYDAHLADAVATRIQAELGEPVVEWAIVDNGQFIHIAGATSPADALASAHGHGTHGPVGVARRTVTRTPWEHLT